MGFHLHVAKFSFVLRGGFGFALRRVSCRTSAPVCDACALVSNCAYPYLFETGASNPNWLVPRFRSAPRPIVIQGPSGPVGICAGSSFSVEVTLVGRGIALLGHVVAAFQHLGQAGLGRLRSRFALDRVVNHDGAGARTVILDGGDSRLKAIAHILLWQDFVGRAQDLEARLREHRGAHLRIDLLTPARLEERDELIVDAGFDVVLRAAIRRVTMMSRLHCGADAVPTVQQSTAGIRTMSADLRWMDRTRSSTRQTRPMRLGGIVGHLTTTPPPRAALEYLCAAEAIHIGKGTTFGHGRIALSCAVPRRPDPRPHTVSGAGGRHP